MHDAVLVPTGRQMKSYGCLRSLNQRGIHTIVASEHDRIPHFSSRYCSERARLASPTRDLLAYKDDLLEIASRPGVETVMPVREFDVYLFAKYRDEFTDHVSLLAPPLDTLQRGHDRLALATEAAKAGVPRAETQRLSAFESWDTDAVIKPRYNLLTDEYVDSQSPRSAVEVKNVRFLPAGETPSYEAIRDEMQHDPIVQEFVPEADKHLYCALWEHGEPRAEYQHRQIRKNSWVGGGGVYRRSIHSAAVGDVARDLLEYLEWHGFVCIEYVKDERTGEWTFLEINPRLWQSLPEAIRAGVDFPYYYWLCTQGNSERIDAQYEDGLACHNSYGELAHLMSVRRDDSPFLDRPSFAGTLWEILTSCLANPRFEYIRADDPRLFLSAVRETLSTGVTESRQFESGG